jgi:hypothetical protein
VSDVVAANEFSALHPILANVAGVFKTRKKPHTSGVFNK